MTSIPRDLLVDIPGVGNQVKINAAYENCGERGDGAGRSRSCSRSTGEPFPINHVDHGRLRRASASAIDYIGCVYADIDRDYFNDQGGPGGYAVIDIDPGYQKLCGKDALAYVRYRHGDNDLVRAARQQDFLRQVRSAKGTRKLMEGGIALGNLKKLARVFARYFDRDKTLDSKQEVFKFAKTVLFTADNPVREVRFRVTDAPDHVNLVALGVDARGDRRRVHEREGARRRRASRPSRPRPTSRRRRSARSSKKNKPSSIEGLEEARAEGENQAIVGRAQGRLPVLLPDAAHDAPRPTRAPSRGPTRSATSAARSTTPTGSCSPRASSASTTASRARPGATRRSSTTRTTTIVRDGRKLMVYRDGKRVRLVAWRTRKAVYWVSNTLTQSLSSAADDRHRRVAEAAAAVNTLARR